MNKKYLILLLLGFVLIFFLFKTQITEFFNFLKLNFNRMETNIYSELNAFQNQSLQIKKLKNENRFLKNKIAYLNSVVYNCRDFKKLIKDSNLTLSKTISYASLPDFSMIYIDYKPKGKFPKGLVYNNLAAGIVVKSAGDYSLALLNSNKKTSYTVYILDGNNSVPGIFYGKIDTIKYIPKFKTIKKGDLVITSGLDGIFYKGAKVGVIENIKETNLYKEAKVKLFYNDLEPNYFYVVDKFDKIGKKRGGEKWN